MKPTAPLRNNFNEIAATPRPWLISFSLDRTSIWDILDPMKRVITICLYFVLAAVILSEIRTVGIAITARDRFTQVFPGAVGFMYYVTVGTSASAGLNAIAVWVGQKWAVWANVIIGVWSILLVGLLGGPRTSQVVILCASGSVLIFSLLLPERFNSRPMS
jgi:hypothetical protein